MHVQILRLFSAFPVFHDRQISSGTGPITKTKQTKVDQKAKIVIHVMKILSLGL